MTFEDLCALLQEKELRLKAREGGGNADAALCATAKGKGNSNSKGNSSKNGDKKKKGKAKFKGECFYCKKKGHTIAKSVAPRRRMRRTGI